MAPTPSVWFLALPIAWLAFVIPCSVVFRIRRGKPIFPSAPADATYAERWGSGRNLSTPWGRLGGANNCLMIAITPDQLWVTPRFPFNLMFLPEIYGLEFRIPLKDINSTERKSAIMMKRVVFHCTQDRVFELRPRDTDAFMAALRRT